MPSYNHKQKKLLLGYFISGMNLRAYGYPIEKIMLNKAPDIKIRYNNMEEKERELNNAFALFSFVFRDVLAPFVKRLSNTYLTSSLALVPPITDADGLLQAYYLIDKIDRVLYNDVAKNILKYRPLTGDLRAYDLEDYSEEDGDEPEYLTAGAMSENFEEDEDQYDDNYDEDEDDDDEDDDTPLFLDEFEDAADLALWFVESLGMPEGIYDPNLNKSIAAIVAGQQLKKARSVYTKRTPQGEHAVTEDEFFFAQITAILSILDQAADNLMSLSGLITYGELIKNNHGDATGSYSVYKKYLEQEADQEGAYIYYTMNIGITLGFVVYMIANVMLTDDVFADLYCETRSKAAYIRLKEQVPKANLEKAIKLVRKLAS